jgi:hypothetical protein
MCDTVGTCLNVYGTCIWTLPENQKISLFYTVFLCESGSWILRFLVQASVTIPCRTATYLLECVHTHFFHPSFRAFPCKFKKMKDKKINKNHQNRKKIGEKTIDLQPLGMYETEMVPCKCQI